MKKIFKKFIIKLIKLFKKKKKQKNTLKPMGVKSYYPPEYKKPQKISYSNGDIEYKLPIEYKQEIYEAIQKLKKEVT